MPCAMATTTTTTPTATTTDIKGNIKRSTCELWFITDAETLGSQFSLRSLAFHIQCATPRHATCQLAIVSCEQGS